MIKTPGWKKLFDCHLYYTTHVFPLAELKALFKLFDADKDGWIDLSEVKQVIQRLGQEVREDHVRHMFNQVDLDGKSIKHIHCSLHVLNNIIFLFWSFYYN